MTDHSNMHAVPAHAVPWQDPQTGAYRWITEMRKETVHTSAGFAREEMRPVFATDATGVPFPAFHIGQTTPDSTLLREASTAKVEGYGYTQSQAIEATPNTWGGQGATPEQVAASNAAMARPGGFFGGNAGPVVDATGRAIG